MTGPREPHPFVTVGVWLALWWSSVALAAMLPNRRTWPNLYSPPREKCQRPSPPALRVIDGGRP